MIGREMTVAIIAANTAFHVNEPNLWIPFRPVESLAKKEGSGSSLRRCPFLLSLRAFRSSFFLILS